MRIKVNLQGNFAIVKEGERVLEITDAKATPSGKPEKLVLHMKDVEDGATLINNYNFNNNISLWAMGMMLNTALGMEDGAEFDTKNAKDLIGIKLLCEVEHSEYNEKTYANVKKVLSRVDDETGVVSTVTTENESTGTRSDISSFLD
jgi:hypothetical protein